MKTLTRRISPLAAPTGIVNRLAPFANPGPAVMRFREEFDRLVSGLFGDFPLPAEFGTEVRGFYLEVENEGELVRVRAEVPGFEPGDFDLRVEDGCLVLRAAKTTGGVAEKGRTGEFCEEECCEVIALPAGIDTDKVAAKYLNGVLTVTLPKTAAGKAKRVPVAGG